MVKSDFKKSLDCYRAKHEHFRVVDVPALQYLSIDGFGDPNTSQAYKDAIATIYPVAYALKFASKNDLDRDYAVMPLEALWWADDMATFTSQRDKSQWQWTAKNMIPDWVTSEMFESAKDKVAPKVPEGGVERIELRRLEEGCSVQTLHIGSYDSEGPILQRMHEEFIPEQDLRLTGKHHEIYLGDARRVAPEKLRTILRQPVVAR